MNCAANIAKCVGKPYKAIILILQSNVVLLYTFRPKSTVRKVYLLPISRLSKRLDVCSAIFVLHSNNPADWKLDVTGTVSGHTITNLPWNRRPSGTQPPCRTLGKPFPLQVWAVVPTSNDSNLKVSLQHFCILRKVVRLPVSASCTHQKPPNMTRNRRMARNEIRQTKVSYQFGVHLRTPSYKQTHIQTLVRWFPRDLACLMDVDGLCVCVWESEWIEVSTSMGFTQHRERRSVFRACGSAASTSEGNSGQKQINRAKPRDDGT